MTFLYPTYCVAAPNEREGERRETRETRERVRAGETGNDRERERGGEGFEFEWGFYAQSASEAIFRARTDNRINYSVM